MASNKRSEGVRFLLAGPPYDRFDPLEDSVGEAAQGKLLAGALVVLALGPDAVEGEAVSGLAEGRNQYPGAAVGFGLQHRYHGDLLSLLFTARPHFVTPAAGTVTRQDLLEVRRTLEARFVDNTIDWVTTNAATLDTFHEQLFRLALNADGGRTSVADLAESLRCSTRTLHRKVTPLELGPTSSLLRSMRVIRTAFRIQNSGAPLHELAYLNGYSDHSAMVRDFH